ncbi:RNA polymerase sigma-70 factor [Galbibacter sp. EGI 63066]|uniref:RNA polymerase sigma-70 factor n=1 Tax=Galbibacter sp. EGI 63066 TaxID=2993559 RepID=UPI002248D1CB|nr:RNA polymerase sigma-70 factor [Galbibacter sp. EGI 63066]MCX2681991.1 RNA polymerase sigma-70 factor [Galbibacter sp. EGI 63066]
MGEQDIYITFKKLFEEHYTKLCSLAYNYLKDIDQSKDVVQEVYIKIWEKKKTVITEANAHYYFYTSVKNNCIDLLRKHKYTLSLDDKVVTEKTSNNLAPDIDEDKSEVNTQEFVQRALDRLPPKCKTIFMMSRFDNMTYAQIADKLGLSVKTVENQMGKAIRIMREFIKENKIITTSLY